MTYKEKLLKRFEEYDKRPHIDYRQIAFNLGLDYHKLSNKYKKLENENKELKEDKETIYQTACELVEYLENTDYIETEQLDSYIATIQQYSK